MPATSIKEDRLSYQYSISPFYPCRVFLQDKIYKDCCCKLEAKDTWFALVHLLGYPNSDVEILSLIDGEEVIF